MCVCVCVIWSSALLDIGETPPVKMVKLLYLNIVCKVERCHNGFKRLPYALVLFSGSSYCYAPLFMKKLILSMKIQVSEKRQLIIHSL